MRVEAGLLYAALLMLSTGAVASTPCANLPAIVDGYLRRHPGWTLVSTGDLVDEDKRLWARYHRGFCPGIAVADLMGDANKWYGLALRHRANGTSLEQLVLIGPNRKNQTERTLAGPYKGDSVLVVWRARRGRYYSYETNRYFFVPHDSIIYELMESSTITYYFARGKLRSVQTSD
jgi:hypothetical protein